MWYEEQRWRARLVAEQELMRSRFPGFKLTRAGDGGLRWVGVIEPVSGYPFFVSLRYPPHYPYQEPKSFVEAPPLRAGAPHVYANDLSLCVHKAAWDPMTGTAAGCVPLVSAWLVAYVNWLESGETF